MVNKFICIKDMIINSDCISSIKLESDDERIIITLKNDHRLFFEDCDEDVFDNILKALETIDVNL